MEDKETKEVKPLPIEINSLCEKLESVINESHIPACVKDPIILNIYNQVRAQAVAEYRSSVEYENSKNEETEDE